MKQSSVNYFVIIPAAGLGTRMKNAIPKQYLTVKGKSILEHTLKSLLSYQKFKKGVVVINKTDKYWPSLQVKYSKLITAIGGQARCNSVLNGLLALKPYVKENDWILVHDAARPFIQLSDIDKLINALKDDPLGGILGTPLKNTIKYIDNKQYIFETLDRRSLWEALTPQMFRYHWLLQALSSAIEKNQAITDEANALELLGKHPKIIEGRADNIKITDPYDLTLFEYYYIKNRVKK